jgi:hypothetical protein
MKNIGKFLYELKSKRKKSEKKSGARFRGNEKREIVYRPNYKLIRIYRQTQIYIVVFDDIYILTYSLI